MSFKKMASTNNGPDEDMELKKLRLEALESMKRKPEPEQTKQQRKNYSKHNHRSNLIVVQTLDEYDSTPPYSTVTFSSNDLHTKVPEKKILPGRFSRIERDDSDDDDDESDFSETYSNCGSGAHVITDSEGSLVLFDSQRSVETNNGSTLPTSSQESKLDVLINGSSFESSVEDNIEKVSSVDTSDEKEVMKIKLNVQCDILSKDTLEKRKQKFGRINSSNHRPSRSVIKPDANHNKSYRSNHSNKRNHSHSSIRNTYSTSPKSRQDIRCRLDALKSRSSSRRESLPTRDNGDDNSGCESNSKRIKSLVIMKLE